MLFRLLIAFVVVNIFSACAYKQPPITLPNHSELGEASYYGSSKSKSLAKTASGEIFNPKALTAAHKTLPFGSLVKIENLDNNKEVVVKINDRGPFAENRIVDVSYAAATELGMIKKGKTKVRLTYLDSNSQ